MMSCLFAAIANAANVATAIPFAYYSPANGSIRIWNDTGGPLAVVNIKPPTGKLTGMPLAVPGTTTDFGDQRLFVVYFNFPPSTSDSST